MLTKVVELPGGVTVTLRRGKIRDRLLMNSIIGKLGFDGGEDTGDFAGKRLFARLVTQAQIDGDLGYTLPAVTDSEDELRASFEKFLDLDALLYDDLEQALFEVDRPLNDPDLLPAEIVPEKKDETSE